MDAAALGLALLTILAPSKRYTSHAITVTRS